MDGLACGCWYICRCKEKAAGESARVLLKMVDLEAQVYTDSSGSISIYIQPYQMWTRKGDRGMWAERALSTRRYTSIENMRKGVSKIIVRKTTDPSYLTLPTPEPESKRFSLQSKRTKKINLCRLVRSQ